MATVISITSGKGGAGKSFVSVGLAVAFAKLGRKAIILELDIGLRCVDIMLGVENRVVYDLGDVVSEHCTLTDAILSVEGFDCLDYIAAPANISSDFQFDRVLDCIRSLKRSYDYVIVDTPAGLGISILSVKNLSDLALIVTTPDPVCIRDGAKVATLIEQADFHNYRLIINRVSKAAMRKSAVHDLDDVIDGVGAQLLGVVPEDAEYQYCLTQGQQPDEKNVTSRVFRAIAARVEGTYIPLVVEKL